MPKKSRSDVIDQIAADARSGRVSRREFIQYAVAAGMSASTGSLFWSSSVSAAMPQRGGTFRWGVHDGNTADTHDPGTAGRHALGEYAPTTQAPMSRAR